MPEQRHDAAAWCYQPFSKSPNICTRPSCPHALAHFSLSPSSCFSTLLPSILHLYPAQWLYINVSRAPLQKDWLLARALLLVIPPYCSCFIGSWVTLNQVFKTLDGELCGKPTFHCCHSLELEPDWWPAGALHEAPYTDILVFQILHTKMTWQG